MGGVGSGRHKSKKGRRIQAKKKKGLWIKILFWLFVLGAVSTLSEADWDGFFVCVAMSVILFAVIKHKKSAKKKPAAEEINNNIPTKEPIQTEQTAPVYNAEERKEPPKFPESYIVLDVETPNRKNDRLCQIGLYVIEHGRIKDNFSTLINPETTFDRISSQVNGISEEDVKYSVTFNKYWNEHKNLFADYVVVAHHAKFDISVILKTLSYYLIKEPEIKYCCTFQAAEKYLPGCTKKSLSDVAQYLGVSPAAHEHSADSDALCCMRVFEEMRRRGVEFIPSIYGTDETSESNIEINLEFEKGDKKVIDIPFSEWDADDIAGKRIVLSGIFSEMDREDLERLISEKGARLVGSVSNLTDFLIVGSENNPDWIGGNYGSKIRKAMNVRLAGTGRVKIIRETDFVNWIKKAE